MYNPPRFQETDLDEAFDFINQNPFATVISVIENKPFISHLSLVAKKSGDQVELIGHLARANPHWRLLSEGPVTAIFQGAHTYVTPKWYFENDVPTWNYSVLHVTGVVELIETDEGIIDCLKDLTVNVEKHWPSGWEFFIPDDLSGSDLTKHIVGFKIKVQEVNFKKKLSQNRSAADRAGVLKGLKGRRDDNSRGVLSDMLRIYSSNGELK